MEKTEEKTGKQIAKVPTPPIQADSGAIVAVVPRSASEAAVYANGLIRGGMVPDGFKEKDGTVNPSLVAAGVLKSLELGLAPQTGLSFLIPLRGRFTIWGDGAQGLVMKSGLLRDIKVEQIGKAFDRDTTAIAKWPNDYGYRVTMWRHGVESPVISEFTVRDARMASLWGKAGPWTQYPDRMLFNRARAFGQRDLFADCLVGLQIHEEVADYEPAPKRLADNSALEDDLTEQDIQMGKPDELPGRIDAYIAGLDRQVSLDGLLEYQQKPENVRLLHSASELDEDQYLRAVQHGASVYERLDRQEQEAARREADEAIEAEIEPVGDQPEQPDLLGGGK